MKQLISILGDRDIRLLYAVNHGIKCRVLDIIMPYITHLGSAGFVVALPTAMIIYRKSGFKILGIEIFIALSASHLIAHVIKRAVNRPRPWIALENVNSYGIRLYNYSFPSGHTTAAFSTAIVLSAYFPLLSSIFIILAFIVGISRMYLGVHYPSDVLIGGAIGSITAALAHLMIL
jgi:undecaprenyl-diphosphatase